MRIRSTLLLVALCLLATSPAVAQDDPDPLWIDVNIGAAFAAAEGYSVLREVPFAAETLRLEIAYRQPTGGLFDFGAGYMFHRRVGVGISFAGTGYRSDATISTSVPHPSIPNQRVTNVSRTDRELVWGDGSMNFQAVFKLTPVESRLAARVFGGPTYFAALPEVVSRFNTEETVNLTTGAYALDVDSYEYAEAEATGWGWHVGADVGYFFSNHVGVGGIFRFQRGTVDFDDPLLVQYDGTGAMKVGGVQIGGGLRLKF